MAFRSPAITYTKKYDFEIEVNALNREAIRKLVIRMNCALDLERKIVGIKFLHTEEDYHFADAKPMTAPLNYCVMVRLATQGQALKASGDTLRVWQEPGPWDLKRLMITTDRGKMEKNLDYITTGPLRNGREMD